MNTQLIFHPKTSQDLDRYLANPSQGILIHAPPGSGKATTAQFLCSKLLNIPMESVTATAQVHYVAAVDKTITIDQIREISKFLKLKVSSPKSPNRLVVIENTEKMSLEAQNAFLKILEEPPTGTLIILTCNRVEAMLPTITSRVQKLNIVNPTKQDIFKLLNKEYSDAELNKAYLLSDGCIGLMVAILDNETEHGLLSQIEVAKQIYKKPIFERLNEVDNIIKSGEVEYFLTALERVCKAALYMAIQKADKSVESWNNRAKRILEAQEYFTHNPNTKLLLSDLFINI